MGNPFIKTGLHAKHPFLQVWAFLNTLTFVPTREEQQGTSRLELLALFELYGGCCEQLDEHVCCKAKSRISLRQTLGIFKSLVKQVGSLCVYEGDLTLLAPSKKPFRRLRNIGFSNFVPCISSLLSLSEEVACTLARALLSMRTRMTKTKRENLDKGLLRLPLRKTSYRGLPTWRDMKCISNEISVKAEDALTKVWPDLYADRCVQTFLLTCRACKHEIQVARRKLFSNGKWASLFCPFCARSSSARRWLCPCHIAWPSCEHHATTGFSCKPRLALRHSKRHTAAPGQLGPNHVKRCCLSTLMNAKCGKSLCLSANAKAQIPTLAVHSTQMQDAAQVCRLAGSSNNGLASASTSLPSSANMLVQSVGTKHGTTGGRVHGSRNKRKPAVTSIGPARKKVMLKQQADHLALESIRRLRQARLDPL